MKEQIKDQKKLLCPKAGTATSSPTHRTPSPTDRGCGKMTQQTAQMTNETSAHKAPLNIVNVMLWMQKNAYEASTIEKVAKLLRHLQKYCNTSEPEEVKIRYY